MGKGLPAPRQLPYSPLRKAVISPLLFPLQHFNRTGGYYDVLFQLHQVMPFDHPSPDLLYWLFPSLDWDVT